MSQSPAVPSSDPVDEETPERDHRLLIVLVALGVLSVVIAAVVITTGGGGSAPAPDTTAELRAGTASLLVGSPKAPAQVVVFEELASPTSRSFDLASRDFLDVMAAAGQVRVEYRPFTTETSGYAAAATSAFGAVLHGGTPKQVLDLQQQLFDRQPGPGQGQPDTLATLGRRAGVPRAVVEGLGSTDVGFVRDTLATARRAQVDRAPVVLLDGRRLEASSPVGLADELQRRVLAAAEKS